MITQSYCIFWLGLSLDLLWCLRAKRSKTLIDHAEIDPMERFLLLSQVDIVQVLLMLLCTYSDFVNE